MRCWGLLCGPCEACQAFQNLDPDYSKQSMDDMTYMSVVRNIKNSPNSHRQSIHAPHPQNITCFRVQGIFCRNFGKGLRQLIHPGHVPAQTKLHLSCPMSFGVAVLLFFELM